MGEPTIAVLGTGMVGQAIAGKLVALGHPTVMGSRRADHPGGQTWAAAAGPKARLDTFAAATAAAEVVFLCVKGEHALAVLESIGAAALAGKVLVDLTNPLDFSKGMPPTLFVSNDDSLGEQIQRAFPTARVVKTLNTLNCDLMVNPGRLPEPTDVFLSGNDGSAKATVRGLLESFGWAPDRITDLGDITTARGTEAWLPLWIRLWGAFKSADYNLRLVRG
ncbi:MAG: NAD(P)-binding domain-containing protein [Myxococcales bacterium]|nr:NAD(P)-binding domain-containing protein [Myxococcales bacterium]MCB9523928.1 NAD(P)-binding domain-containing protein [Myxococcales bacterium]